PPPSPPRPACSPTSSPRSPSSSSSWTTPGNASSTWWSARPWPPPAASRGRASCSGAGDPGTPAASPPRAAPGVRELFRRWLPWDADALPGGCLFVAASAEFDDQPGPVRDRLPQDQRDWVDTIGQGFAGGG